MCGGDVDLADESTGGIPHETDRPGMACHKTHVRTFVCVPFLPTILQLEDDAIVGCQLFNSKQSQKHGVTHLGFLPSHHRTRRYRRMARLRISSTADPSSRIQVRCALA